MDFIIGFSVIVVPLSLVVIVYANILAAIMKICSAQGQIKAFSPCASHITVVTVFAIPCIIRYMSPGPDSWSNSGKKMALSTYNTATAFLNPVIYSLRNKDFPQVDGMRQGPFKLKAREQSRTHTHHEHSPMRPGRAGLHQANITLNQGEGTGCSDIGCVYGDAV